MKWNNTYKTGFLFSRFHPLGKTEYFCLRLSIMVSSFCNIIPFISGMTRRSGHSSSSHSAKENLHPEHYVLVNNLRLMVSDLCAGVSLRRYGFSDWTLADLKAAKVRSSSKKDPYFLPRNIPGSPAFSSIAYIITVNSGGRRTCRL